MNYYEWLQFNNLQNTPDSMEFKKDWAVGHCAFDVLIISDIINSGIIHPRRIEQARRRLQRAAGNCEG